MLLKIPETEISRKKLIYSGVQRAFYGKQWVTMKHWPGTCFAGRGLRLPEVFLFRWEPHNGHYFPAVSQPELEAGPVFNKKDYGGEKGRVSNESLCKMPAQSDPGEGPLPCC